MSHRGSNPPALRSTTSNVSCFDDLQEGATEEGIEVSNIYSDELYTPTGDRAPVSKDIRDRSTERQGLSEKSAPFLWEACMLMIARSTPSQSSSPTFAKSAE